MKRNEGIFEGVKGLKIYYQVWTPESPKAVVQFVHGGGAHSGLAPHLVDKLVSEMYVVFADDHRGHGKSEGERIYVDSFDDYIEDEKLLHDIIKNQYPSLPVFLGGLSLGSIIAFHFASKYEDLLKGLFLTGTLASVKVPLIARVLSSLLAKIKPHMRIGEPMEVELSSSNPEAIKMLKTDPYYTKVAFTMRFTRELIKAWYGIAKTAGNLKLPLLVQNGNDDKMVELFNGKNDATAFNETFKMEDKTIKLYEGVGHDIFNDFEEKRNKILQDLIDWLNKHLD